MTKQKQTSKKDKKIIIYSSTAAGVIIIGGAVGAGVGVAIHNRTTHNSEVKEENKFLDKVAKDISASQTSPIMAKNKAITFKVASEQADIQKAQELGLTATADQNLFTISEMSDDGEIQVTSTGKSGSGDVLLSTDNSSKSKKLNVFDGNPKPLVVVDDCDFDEDTDLDKTNFTTTPSVEKTQTIILNDPQTFANLQVAVLNPDGSIDSSGSDKAKIALDYDTGKITIKPLIQGDLSIGIFADNVTGTKEGKTAACILALSVQPKLDLTPTSGDDNSTEINTSPKLGETSKINITNADDYENLSVASDQTDVATVTNLTYTDVTDDNQQKGTQRKTTRIATFNVIPTNPGKANIIIKADNANEQIIPFVIPSRINPYLDDVAQGFITGHTCDIKIDNLNDMVNVNATSSDNNVFKVDSIDATNETIRLIGQGAGSASLKIDAANITQPQTIQLQVADDAKLANLDLTTLNPNFITNPRVGESQAIIIGNPKTLINLGAQSDNPDILGVNVDQDTATINLVPIAQGTANITIRADDSTSEKVIAITCLPKEDIVINDEANLNTTPKIGENVKLKIDNYVDIINPNIQTSDDNVATITNDHQGNITLNPINPGIATLMISGDNINQKDLDFIIPDRVTIVLDDSTTPKGIKVGATITISVPDYQNLVDPKVTSSDSTILSVESYFVDGNTITIKGLKPGVAKVIISAANITANKEVSLTVATPVDVATPNENLNLSPEIGEDQVITLPNFNQLVNPRITTQPSKALKVTINQDSGTIIFKPLISGTIQATITADNAINNYEFSLNVPAKHDISFEQTPISSLKIGQVNELSIADFSALNLINLQIESSNQQVADVSEIDRTGKFSISALGSGTTTITLSGDNINSTSFTLTVLEKISTIITQTRTGLVLTDDRKTTTFSVDNYQDLVDPVAISSDPDILSVDSSDLANGGIVRVTALGLGSASVVINSKNSAQTTNVAFTVLSETAVDIDTDGVSTSQKVNINQILQVQNYAQEVNLRVTGDAIDRGLISASIDQNSGRININPLKAGTANFNVESDNSNLTTPTSFSWTIKSAPDDTDYTNLAKSTWMKTTNLPSTLRFGESATIEVNTRVTVFLFPYDMPDADKQSLNILSNGNDIVDVQKEIDDNNHLITFTLTAKKAGNEILKIISSGMLGETFGMNVEAKHDYNHVFDRLQIWIGNQLDLNLNSNDYINLVISSTNNAVIEPKKDTNKNWFLEATGSGKATINIQADNMKNSRTYDFEVATKTDITIPSFNPDLNPDQTSEIKLGRVDDLVNPELTSSDTNLAKINLIERDGWYYAAINTFEVAGEVTFSLTADNINPYHFKMQVTSLAREDFLAMSDNLFATSTGVYDQDGNLIAADALSGMSSDEILAMSGNIIATTRGVYNINGRQLSPYVLKDLTKNDILGLSDTVIATTKGIFNQQGVEIAKSLTTYSNDTIYGVSGSVVVTQQGLYNDSGSLLNSSGVTFDKSDILSIGKSLIVTTKGVFRTYSSLLFPAELYYYSQKLRGLTADDILMVGNSAVATTKGIYNTQDQQVMSLELGKPTADDIWALSDKIITTSKGVYQTSTSWLGFSIPIRPLRGLQKSEYLGQGNNIIATTKGVYNYDGEQLGGDALVGLTTADILAISDNFIVTTKGVYNLDNHLIGGSALIGLTLDDIISVQNNIIATTKGVYNYNGEQLGGTTLVGINSDQVYGVTNNFIVTAFGTWTSENKRLI